MKLQENWGVLISQTGSEVIAIAKEIGFLPSLLVTNHLHRVPKDNLEFFGRNGVIVRTVPFRPTLENYLIIVLVYYLYISEISDLLIKGRGAPSIQDIARNEANNFTWFSPNSPSRLFPAF